LYPSIDHIIPLALGGYHERRNVHTAHRICNSRKQARAQNDQLRLIG
jgi:5-methylcytosine-specific restriction endonuclease McrA